MKIDGDTATVGISHHASEALGDIVHCELPEVGTVADAGEAVITVESVKASADVYTPVAGEVIETNSSLEDKPETINGFPHEEGWMIKVKVSDASPLDALMDSATYTEYEQSES